MAEVRSTSRGGGRLSEVLARSRVPLGFVCAGAVLWLARPSYSSIGLGGTVATVGELIRIWAAGHLEKGREVTQSGPYRFTRHPLYAGSALIGVGVAIAAANVLAAVLVAGYLSATIAAAIRHEEANMRAAFGDEYDAYAASTGGARGSRIGRRFSLARALWNKEYRAVIGLLLMAAVFAFKAARHL